MKKTVKYFVIALCALCAGFMSLSAAPVKKGNFVVTLPVLSYSSFSGDLYESASEEGEDGDALSELSLFAGNYELGIQYFIIDGLAIGGLLGYESSAQGDAEESTLSFGPAVHYYYDMGKMIPFGGLAYVYQSTTSNTGEEEAEDVEYTDTSIRIDGGLVYMLTDELAGYGSLLYTFDSREYDGGDPVEGNELGVRVGIKAFF